MIGSIFTILSETVFYTRPLSAVKGKYITGDENITAQNIGDGQCRIVPSEQDVSKIENANEAVINIGKEAKQEEDNSSLPGFVKVANNVAGIFNL